jgi:maltooligosyltrehalose trehalohydrolase
VLLDVVYNHGGPEGNYLSEFGPYWSDQARTSWGEGFNLDGPDSDEVRRYVVDNAVYWITEYHLDGLRLDAADRIVDFGALHILEELTTAVHQQGGEMGRGTLVIAESDANDPRYVRPVSKGGYGIDAQWSDDFHHAVHAALTGERQGYFADFGEIESVAKAIQRRFVNDGRYSPSRRRRHGRAAEDVPGDRFVICVQNHDQIGNRAAGERLSVLVPPPARRLAAAVLLLSPYVPLLFMGEEFDEVAPFQYFVSHTDPELCRLVSEGRRREFAAFAWSGAVPDPSDEATFLRSKLDWGLTAAPAHARMLALHRDLLRLRRTEPGLRPGAARPVARHDMAEGSVVVELESLDHRLVALYNFSDAPQTITIGDFGWEPILSTESADYGGSDGAVVQGTAATLPPFSALLLRTRPA